MFEVKWKMNARINKCSLTQTKRKKRGSYSQWCWIDLRMKIFRTCVWYHHSFQSRWIKGWGDNGEDILAWRLDWKERKYIDIVQRGHSVIYRVGGCLLYKLPLNKKLIKVNPAEGRRIMDLNKLWMKRKRIVPTPVQQKTDYRSSQGGGKTAWNTTEYPRNNFVPQYW